MSEKENPYCKKFSVFSNLKFVFGLMKKYSPVTFFLLPLAAVVAAANRYSATFLLKFLVDIISDGGTLRQIVAVVASFSVILMIAANANTWLREEFSERCIVARLKLILEKNLAVMTMPFVFTEDPDMQDCEKRASNAVNGNYQSVEGMMRDFLNFAETLSLSAVGLIIIGAMNFKITAAMLVIAVLNFLIMNFANKWTKKNVWDPLAQWWRKHWYMSRVLSDFSYAKDIRMFGLKNYLTQKFQKLNETRYQAQKTNCKVWFWVAIANSVFFTLSQIVVYAYLVRCVFNKTIEIGNFILYLSASSAFFEYITEFFNCVNSFLNDNRYVNDFRSFYENEKVRENLTSEKHPKQILRPQKSYEFEFQNVSFKYPRAERFALQNVNVKINAGERLAVIGLNGAGKTTFIKLLTRLYEPTEGKILLNGTDVREYDLNSYFNIFSPVFQEINLFAMSFAENVSMKSADETDKDFAKAAIIQSGLEEKLNSLEKGLDAQLLKIIYDDGIDLSGGQKQKLALARALYKNAPVAVLDEPTAALDAIAESKLYSDFDKLIGGKTSVYISHRLSSTQFCDNIAMFKDGRLIEYGSHNFLMNQNGEYANMFKVQAQYYLENENCENADNSGENHYEN